MSHRDEPSGDEQPVDRLDRASLVLRVQELEHENEHLRRDLTTVRLAHAKDRELLNALVRQDLPRDRVELLEWFAHSRPLTELLGELEQEFGLEFPK